jgi:hypothetical protein
MQNQQEEVLSPKMHVIEFVCCIQFIYYIRVNLDVKV